MQTGSTSQRMDSLNVATMTRPNLRHQNEHENETFEIMIIVFFFFPHILMISGTVFLACSYIYRQHRELIDFKSI